jgi:UMF1 family MFS transporter
MGFNLTMVMMPEWYGISDGSLPARISFYRLASGGLVLQITFITFPIIFSQGIGERLYL